MAAFICHILFNSFFETVYFWSFSEIVLEGLRLFWIDITIKYVSLIILSRKNISGLLLEQFDHLFWMLNSIDY